jgi:outer membrane protein assembly factor BamA
MRRPFLLALALVLVTAPVRAQEPEASSRAELLAKMREQKAQQLQPYEPKGIEKALLYMEERRVLERFSVADGWYPRIGGLTTGGGFAGGVGYRTHVFGDRLFLNTSAAISTKAYKQFTAQALYPPPIWNGRVELGAGFRWNDFPQEDYFGRGNDSVLDRRVNYGLKTTDFTGMISVRPLRRLRVGAEVGHLSPSLGPGTDPRFPSLETLFDDAEAPGLLEDPSYLYKNLFVEIDYRDQPGNPRSGGLWRAKYGAWDDRELQRYDFGRFDAEVAHFFPIFDKKRVFAFRMRLSYTNNDPDNRIPFYFLPYIGGSDSIRGYKEFRFRDENAVFMNAEYRWEAFAGLDMALFFDAGKVRPDWEDINLQDMKTSYGVGFRFNTFKSVFMRLDLGFGGEGTQIFFKFGPAF